MRSTANWLPRSKIGSLKTWCQHSRKCSSQCLVSTMNTQRFGGPSDRKNQPFGKVAWGLGSINKHDQVDHGGCVSVKDEVSSNLCLAMWEQELQPGTTRRPAAARDGAVYIASPAEQVLGSIAKDEATRGIFACLVPEVWPQNTLVLLLCAVLPSCRNQK